jgi:hypothetical protein
MAGYRKIIDDSSHAIIWSLCRIAGGKVMPPSDCPNVVAMDACKQDYYITGHCHPHNVQVRYGTMEGCMMLQSPENGKGMEVNIQLNTQPEKSFSKAEK